MIAKEGWGLVAGATGLAILLTGLGAWLGGPWVIPLATLGWVLAAFTIYFFRDPSRTTPPGDDHLVYAPADGKVVEIVEEQGKAYVDGMTTRISIFLSPLNVHVNRIPVSGTIEHVDYIPGEYLVAWHPKASEKNERSELGLRHASGIPVMFKQIAGAVARRIVFHLHEGQRVQTGERFGIVKFGSRMDVIVPSGKLNIQTSIGSKVRAGETVLGTLVHQPDQGS